MDVSVKDRQNDIRAQTGPTRQDRPRLEDVASGYWTLFIKQLSGLVSHYGSIPSSSA